MCWAQFYLGSEVGVNLINRLPCEVKPIECPIPQELLPFNFICNKVLADWDCYLLVSTSGIQGIVPSQNMRTSRIQISVPCKGNTSFTTPSDSSLVNSDSFCFQWNSLSSNLRVISEFVLFTCINQFQPAITQLYLNSKSRTLG